MKTMVLSELPVNQKAKLLKWKRESEDLIRYLEVGFVDGAVLEVLYRAPLGGDPIAVKVRGSLFAMRVSEAKEIIVELCHE
jgi:ferrous iron transport protein A